MSKIINCTFSLMEVMRISQRFKKNNSNFYRSNKDNKFELYCQDDNKFYSFIRYFVTKIKLILEVQLKNDMISKKESYINLTRFVGSR